MFSYYKFPFDKIKKASNVVLWGGGKVGESMYCQCKDYCNIVAVIDKDNSKIFNMGRKCDNSGILKIISYDYILVCVSDAIFDDVYNDIRKVVPIELDYKIISVSIAPKENLDEIDVAAMNDSFHWHIEDQSARNETIRDYSSLYRDRTDKYISSDTFVASMLLYSYEYVNPVLHIIDSENRYIGTFDKNSFLRMNDIHIEGLESITVGKLIEKLKACNINLYIASESAETVNSLYSKFVANTYDEIPILENGKMIGIIDRISFISTFLKMEIPDNEMYNVSRGFASKGRIPMLNQYAYNVNSQNGEDGILKRIFELISFQSKVAVEFGGWDGIYLSNIRNLVLENDMRAIFIEGDKEKAEEGRQNYIDNPNVTFVNEFVGIKKYKRLDDILSEHKCPSDIDLLSIDIDGWDYWVWDSLTKYRPRIVVIEFVRSMFKEKVVINPKDEQKRTGTSARAMLELGKKKGYELICVTGGNLIFCIKEEYKKIGIKDNSLDALWANAGDQCLFVTFTGDAYGKWIYNKGEGTIKEYLYNYVNL